MKSPRNFGGVGRHRAFTLIELLVVIAIIGVLASIAVPTMLSVRHRGQSAACMSNLRQIGVTVALYTTDHTGLLPEAWNASSGVSYATILEPYLSQATDRVKHDRKNIFVCPGNTLPVAEGSAGIITYSMNVVLGSGTVRLMQIPSPSTTFLFTDGTQITANRNLSSASIYEPWQLFWGSNPEEVVPTTQDADGTAAGWIRYRHGGAANFLMVDGHVEAIKKGSLLSKNGGMMGL